MEHALTLHLPEDLHESLAEAARRAGQTPEETALQWLAQAAPQSRLRVIEAEAKAAWQRLRQYAGAAESGDPRSADNERLDADLAREDGSPLEERP